jgi:hypothetical protein
MDATANLKEQRKIAADILKVWDGFVEGVADLYLMPAYVAEQANRLAELVQALDGWMTAGGSPPSQWR